MKMNEEDSSNLNLTAVLLSFASASDGSKMDARATGAPPSAASLWEVGF